jgi:hypothetical protein
MADRWHTVRRHDRGSGPGLDLSRVIVMGFLIAALFGMATGVGWVGCQLIRHQFGG